jgi:hypothetical protein
VSHNRDHIITFSTPITEGSRVKVWHCAAALGVIGAIVGALLF